MIPRPAIKINILSDEGIDVRARRLNGFWFGSYYISITTVWRLANVGSSQQNLFLTPDSRRFIQNRQEKSSLPCFYCVLCEI